MVENLRKNNSLKGEITGNNFYGEENFLPCKAAKNPYLKGKVLATCVWWSHHGHRISNLNFSS